jgi:hypothetical protein
MRGRCMPQRKPWERRSPMRSSRGCFRLTSLIIDDGFLLCFGLITLAPKRKENFVQRWHYLTLRCCHKLIRALQLELTWIFVALWSVFVSELLMKFRIGSYVQILRTTYDIFHVDISKKKTEEWTYMDGSDVHGCSNSWEDGIFSRWSIESFKFFLLTSVTPTNSLHTPTCPMSGDKVGWTKVN